MDAKLDALYEQAQVLDTAERERRLRQLEAYIHDQAPWLFLHFQPSLYGENKKLVWGAPANERLIMFGADLQ